MRRQRFELNCVLDDSPVPRGRESVRAHPDLRGPGVGKPDYAHRVNSVYLDSAFAAL